MFQSTIFILLLLSFSTGDQLSKYLKVHPHGRIVGGNETTIEENPWQVSLQIFGLHNCGGSIIRSDTILTAAHCIGLISQLYEVVAGTADLLQNSTRLRIRDTIIHQLYDGVEYDIAILKLDQHLTFSDRIQPIALPETEIADGETVTVTGWGYESESDTTPQNNLRSVQIQIINNRTCAKEYANVENSRITPRMICAGSVAGGKDSCQGDSGGPLSKDGILYGIVSWGLGCGEIQHPGVYTNVFKFVDWIHENAGL